MSEFDDEMGFACDCIASKIYAKLPGTPGRSGRIPYRAVYDSQDEARRRGYWIPGVPIKAKITKVEKDTKFGLHLINAYLYTIELEHGPFRWSVVKRNKDFAVLAARLLTHRAAERIRAPVKRAAEAVDDVLESVGLDLLPEHSSDCIYNRRNRASMNERLEAWLQAVLHIPVNRNHHETAEFLEVSRFSFVNELGGKYAEGFVKKRPGGNRVFIGWKQFCVRHFLCWSKRWLILKDSSVCYMDANNEQIRFVIFFDRDFGVSAGVDETEGMPSGLILSNQQHELALKCATPLDAEKWKMAILETMNGVGRIWREPHPYGSTYPVRRSQSVNWFVDGRSFMEHAANMLELAREEIFIADWWLSPEIYLKRPLIEGNRWRLDELLKRKAEEGIKIFVLLYKEMEMALGINSIYTKKTLQGLHKNIKVLRHPDHYISSGTFFWAHHEKLIIVDQLVAFVGGIDLCYGRWDEARHKLVDLGSVKYGEGHAFNIFKLHGMRSLAAASATFSPLGLEDEEICSKSSEQICDIDEVDRASQTEKQSVSHAKEPSVNYWKLRPKYSCPPSDLQKVPTVVKATELNDQDEKIKGIEMEGAGKIWLGKDYVNFIRKDFVQLDMPYHDFIDRGSTPRMPWHDIHAVTYGSSARDLARHFIQRWNATKTEKSKDLKDYPFLLPKSYDTIKVPRVLSNISILADVQVLRSVSKWSSLINHTEDSIQQAYLSLIANSRHCIYIENQFFVSLIESHEVYNEICRVLCDRIKRAYYDKENFRVYILVPLLPGFEGDVGTPGGSALTAVLNWTYLSLSRGPNSLLENLKKVVPDPMKYISVNSLRTYDILCGKLVSELIYIHCKLMIVDDKSVIIGSANINDRSQMGNRDSEVCILIKDIDFIPSKMNGRPYEAGKFAISLRKRLMMEHLGMLPEQVRQRKDKIIPDIDLDDPVIDSFFIGTWKSIAKKNTKIYEDVFRVYPTDQIHSFEELKVWAGQMPMSEYSPQIAEEQLRDLIGTLVEFPLNFLLKEDLAPGLGSKEGLVPTSVFT
ncbi:unnamed protein product [Dracunculus medinensis]|uniref:Phospholipase n=1 Tax=Dracunculus medinensis TaxID=318479 RepID=A0A0N4UM24_DRAME|nr:unnamed protein product [Dracunculus medinensis]